MKVSHEFLESSDQVEAWSKLAKIAKDPKIKKLAIDQKNIWFKHFLNTE